MIRLMLVDDHGLIRDGLNTLLTQASDIQVVASCVSLQAAYPQLAAVQPHVILIPLRLLLDRLDVFLETVRLASPHTFILVLSHNDQDIFVQPLFSKGVKGYLANPMTADELFIAVRKVAQGMTYVSASVAKRLVMHRWQLSHKKETSPNPFSQLSAREKQYSQYLSEGKSADSISREMGVTLKTVNTYRYRLFQKLGVSGEVEFIKLALQYGLLTKDTAG